MSTVDFEAKSQTPFGKALLRGALVFEPRPSMAKTAESAQSKATQISEQLRDVSRLDAINLPEIVRENHEGKPKYSSIFDREYARGIATSTGKEPVINKVVAQLKTYADFRAWLIETQSMGIN